MNENEETITRAELSAALERFARKRLYGKALLSDEIFSDVKAHREPEWVAFDLVQDADGAVWQRSPNSGSWWKMGREGLYRHALPVRPLVKLGNAKPPKGT